MLGHPKLAHVRHVKLRHPPAVSRFWRYHNAGHGCVSTIEALTLLFQEYRASVLLSKCDERSTESAPLDASSAIGRFVVQGCDAHAAHSAALKRPRLNLSEMVSQRTGEITPKAHPFAGAATSLPKTLPEARLLLLFGLISDAISTQVSTTTKHAFSLPRPATTNCAVGRAADAGAVLPMSEAAKEAQRAARRQNGTERQARQREAAAQAKAQSTRAPGMSEAPLGEAPII